MILSNRRVVRVSVLAALLALFTVFMTPRAASAAEVSTGRAEQCNVDSSSSCLVSHGFGETPTSVVVTPRRAAFAYVTDVTSTTYRVFFDKPNGSNFATGTLIKYFVHYDFGTTPTPTPTPTPTVTPTPTPTVTPTPTPTPTPPPAECTNPNFTDHATGGSGGAVQYEDQLFPTKEYEVHNNMWNNYNGGVYDLSACDYDNWYVDVKQPKPSDNGVQAYPNVHRNYFHDEPLTTIKSAKFGHTTPAECNGCVYNVAFDIWINRDFDNELMIWTENKGQFPYGYFNSGKRGEVTFDGFTYDVYHEGSVTTYVSQVTQKSGTMDLSKFFAHMASDHDPNTAGVQDWIGPPVSGKTVDTTWQVDYGVETVSTANTTKRFTFTDFAITEQ